MVYVLRLENDNYYVGFTTQGYKRISQHFQGCGARWTQVHKPLEVVEIIENGDSSTERDKTEEYSRRFGEDKVRGYARTAVIPLARSNKCRKTHNSRRRAATLECRLGYCALK